MNLQQLRRALDATSPSRTGIPHLCRWLGFVSAWGSPTYRTPCPAPLWNHSANSAPKIKISTQSWRTPIPKIPVTLQHKISGKIICPNPRYSSAQFPIPKNQHPKPLMHVTLSNKPSWGKVSLMESIILIMTILNYILWGGGSFWVFFLFFWVFFLVFGSVGM